MERSSSGGGFIETITNSIRRHLPILVAAVLIATGSGLSVAASFPITTIVGTDAYEGTAPPGVSLRPLNQTGHTFAVFASVLPCPLFVYPLTELEHQRYLDDGTLPPQALTCSRPSIVKGQPSSHLLLRNIDPQDSFEYMVDAEFSRIDLPYLWMAIPGLVLLVVGGIPLTVLLLLRGMGRLGNERGGATVGRQGEKK